MLIESRFENHHIDIIDDGNGIHARLTDESGEADILDETREIGSDGDGHFSIPLRSGSRTPGSAEEVVYLLSKFPLSVTIHDESGENEMAIDRSRMPESDEQRLLLITAGDGSLREVERDLQNRDLPTPPEWYVAYKDAWSAPGPSLFP